MVSALKNKHAAIAQACARFGVDRIDDFRPGQSDMDLLVEFGAMHPHDLVDAYFGLLDELRAVLAVEIDLVVMVDAVKNRFIAAGTPPTKR